MVKKWPNNDKNSFEKYKIFTEALAKINFENHKELAMNEVHVTTAKVVLLSIISGAAVALLTHLFFKIWIKKLNAFGRFFFWHFFYENLSDIQNLTPTFSLEFFSTFVLQIFLKIKGLIPLFDFLITISMTNVTQP